MTNGKENQKGMLPRKNARDIIENCLIPSLNSDLVLSYLNYIFNFKEDFSCSENLGNSLESDVIKLSELYLIYASTLDNKTKKLYYIDAALMLNPKCSAPKHMILAERPSVSLHIGLIPGMTTKMINIDLHCIKYELSDKEREKMNIIINTRRPY
ncbi:MAG: hypothetical protein AABW91_00085 [Nanoarchaeota archaeon]